MTDQQIKSLSQRYAEEHYNVRGGVDVMADEAENIIRYILQTHEITQRKPL